MISTESVAVNSPTSVTVWIVTSAPFEGTTRSAEQLVSVENQSVTTLKDAVLNTYEKVGELPFSPVHFGVRQANSVLMHGQIEQGQVKVLG